MYRTDESVLRLVGHIERMGNESDAKRVYVGEDVGNRLAGRPRKMWIDTVSEIEKKRGLDIRQTREWYMMGMNGRGL